MNAATRAAYRHIPSFRREHGGLYHLYASVYSRAYAARARHRHSRGRHGPALCTTGRCHWCGQSPER